MKRMYAAAALAVAIGLGGCQTKAPESEAVVTTEAETKENQVMARSIVDHDGNQVILPETISRIAVTDTLPLPSVLSLYLGSADQLVGVSPVSMSAAKAGLLGELFPTFLQADTAFFANNELNIESLLALQPDVVFYNAGNEKMKEALQAAGLTAVAVSVTKWNYDAKETFDAWMELLAQIFPEHQEKAEAAKAYSARVEAELLEKTEGLSEEERKEVFFLFNYNDTAIITSGKNFWGQYWCDSIGAKNAAEEIEAERSGAAVNMEQIYSWDPDLIFISNFTAAMPEDLYENKIGAHDWSPLTAVQEKQVYKLPLGAYRSFTPGADTPLTMQWMAKVTYPELFEELDMTEEVKQYYQEVFGISLTDQQVASMYTPDRSAADGYHK